MQQQDDVNRPEHITPFAGASKANGAADQIKEYGGADFLDAGLRYIARGWRIFPCNGKKEPLTDHGFKDATTDEQQIRSWAQLYDGALWGCALPKDVLVIDLDIKHGKNGIREFEKLQGCKPEEFDAPRVATATGGNHIYTDATGRDFKNSTDEIAKGIDTRSEGGYVIIPSGPQSGYRWLTDPDTPMPPAPAWTEAALRREGKSNGGSKGNGRTEWPEGFAKVELEKACEGIQHAGKGERDKACQDHAMWIGHLAGGGAFDPMEARAALINAAQLNKGGGEAYVNKVKAAFDKALKEPIAAPPIRIQAGDRKDPLDAVESALISSGCGLFQRGGLVVRIDWWPMKTWDEKDIQIQAIVECGNDYLTEVIATVCTFARYNERKKGWVRCDPPDWVARSLKQRQSRLRLSILNGVTNYPIMRANGELVTTPGYHKETGVYYDPRGVEFPAVSDAPTKEDARRALDRLKKLFSTFPFVDDASRSVALSLLLTTVARRALDFAPLHAFDSPAAGTGKSMIVDIVSIVATGEQAGVVAHTDDQKEFDKHLSAILMRGIPLIAIDNCEGPLKGVLLNQTLTQPITECRILGKSESVAVRSNSTLSATGNNLVIEGDTTRRSICGRMDAGVERPELLKFDYSPLDDARENRAELVAAGMTVLRAYHLAGRPNREVLGSFKEWSWLVRGALLWLGEADPVGTMEELRKHDPRASSLKTVMMEWGKIWKDNPATVHDMIKWADVWESGRGHVHTEWRSAVMTVAGVGNNINSRKFGHWLSSVKGKIVAFGTDGNPYWYKITDAGISAGRQKWVLEKVSPNRR